MTLITRRHALALGGTALGSGAALLPSLARAADWPSGPVTLVVGLLMLMLGLPYLMPVLEAVLQTALKIFTG